MTEHLLENLRERFYIIFSEDNPRTFLVRFNLVPRVPVFKGSQRVHQSRSAILGKEREALG